MQDKGKTLICKCDCGKIKEIGKKNVIYGRTKSCGCYNAKLISQRAKSKDSAFRRSRDIHTGTDLIINDIFAPIRKRAKERGIFFDLSPIDLDEKFKKQCGRCVFTGILLSLPTTAKERRKCLHTASLDRIDNSKGYVKGNIQWIHKRINIMRHKLSIEEFLDWCFKITEYHHPKFAGK